MNKSILKIIFRKIREQKGQFLSLVAISAIGVAMFTGVLSVPSIMQRNAQDHFTEQNLADITLTNPKGFTSNDISKIKSTLDNVTIEKSIMFDALINNNNVEYVSRIHSNSKISKPHLLEGRLIKNNNECLVDEFGKDLLNKKVTIDALQQKQQCKVVGVANSPEYFNASQKGFSSVSTGQIKMIVFLSEQQAKSFFDFSVNKYNQIQLTLNNKPTNETFTESYKSYVDSQTTKLDKSLNNSNIIITPRHENTSVSSYFDDSSRISEIAAIFPIIFFVVAALVGSSSMSRMVEDDRSQIGTLSALGYSRMTITAMYLCFSLSAVLIGFTIGLLAGFNLIPPVVMDAYSSLYKIGTTNVYYDLTIIIQALVASLTMIVGATLIVTLIQTKETCAILMRPKAPLAGKKVFIEKIPFIWNHLSFIRKVSFRNLFRYKKRLIMSILAIMGCSGLLMTGLGIETSIKPIINLQFNEIYKYQAIAHTIPLNSTQTNEKETELKKIKGIDATMSAFRSNAIAKKDNKEFKFTVVVPDKNKELNNFINFKEKFGDDDVFVTQKLAQSLNVTKGDKIALEIDNKKYEFKINKIVEQYVGNYLYINNHTFKKAMPNFKYNSIILRHSTSEDTLNKNLKDSTFIKAIEHNKTFKDNVNTSMEGINNLVYIMIGFAGLLVVVVMYSLTNINLTERKRELATLKVLGFYDKEVASYVFRENIILTIMGLLIGLLFGKYLHIYIISMAELPDMYFLKTQPLINYGLTIIITLAFSLSVNLIMRSKINKINMVDSLKSIE